jgi:hypothetical protein
VIGLLAQTADVAHAIAWARDLWEQGHEEQDIVDLALLSPDDWQSAAILLPKVMDRFGLRTIEAQHLYIERHLLRAYLSQLLSEQDLIDAGYEVWRRLLYHGPNPFSIYDEIGDLVSVESGGGDLFPMPPLKARKMVVEMLVKDGAFDRVGLAAPDL